MRAKTITCAMAVFLLAPVWTEAAVPAGVAIEGALLTAAGGPVSDGDYEVSFHLFAAAEGGQAVWSETVAKLSVKGGAFAHTLGTISKLPTATVDGAKAGWLAIQIGAEPMLPRNPVRSVPFAIRAAIAEAADFTYAGSKTKGGPANDLSCTGCVGVSELLIDGDLDLGGHALKAKAVAADSVTTAALTATTVGADTVTAKVFVGDGSKLSGLKLPTGKCKVGQAVVGVQADGSLICASTADVLPQDGLDNVSGGLLTNEFAFTFNSAAAVKIQDNNPIGVASEIVVADVGTAKKFTVTVDVANSDFGTVEAWLFGPDGSKYLLFSKDKAVKALKTTYPMPSKPVSGDLSAWLGKNPKGKWILKVIDTGFKDNGFDGAINAWSINIEVLSTKKTDSKGLLSTSGGFQMQIAAAHPVPCDAAAFGRMYLNSKDKKFWVCRDTWDAVLFADCGNGVKEFPEECDNGAQNGNNPGACRSDCKNPICGDKIVDPGEACDDGNKVDNDTCKNDCTSPCKGWVYKGICLMHGTLSGDADKVPAGCTPYQPSTNWGQADFIAICQAASKKIGWSVNCGSHDTDADGGLCTNFKAIASWEGPGQGSPDVWVRKPTFNWNPVGNGAGQCHIYSYSKTAVVYACK